MLSLGIRIFMPSYDPEAPDPDPPDPGETFFVYDSASGQTSGDQITINGGADSITEGAP